jgi:hypothetical protein
MLKLFFNMLVIYYKCNTRLISESAVLRARLAKLQLLLL